MATGTLILRPSADISLGHDVYPTDLGAGYLAINEEVDDGEATYLSVTSVAAADGAREATSTFALAVAGGLKVKIYNVSAVTAFATCTWGGSGNTPYYAKVEVLIDDVVYVTSDNTGSTQAISFDCADLVEPINSYIANNNGALPNILLRITNGAYPVATETDDKTAGTVTNYSSATSKCYQAYIELTCEYKEIIGICHKVNGEWMSTVAAYQKQGGVWAEITEDEAKSILSSSLCEHKFPVAITVRLNSDYGENWDRHTRIEYNGTVYTSAQDTNNETIQLATFIAYPGDVITCYCYGCNDTGDGYTADGYVYLNDEIVQTAEGSVATEHTVYARYDYVVVSDATIEMRNENGGMVVFGHVHITDANA